MGSELVSPGGARRLQSSNLRVLRSLVTFMCWVSSVQLVDQRFLLVTIVHLVHVTLCHAPSDVKLCGSMPSACK